MSYNKQISNYIVKFKDEESYLEAKLENLKLYVDIPFIGFIQYEMYDKEKCEVESIEEISTSTFAVADSSDIWNFTVNEIGDNNNDVVISGNLIVDGTISTSNGSFMTGTNVGEGTFNNITSLCGVTKSQLDGTFKEEEIIDPIDSRFDLLDLQELLRE